MALSDFRTTSVTPITQGGVPVTDPSTQFFGFSNSAARPFDPNQPRYSRTPESDAFGPAFDYAEGQQESFLDFQSGIRDDMMGLYNNARNDIFNLQSTLDPNAPWAEQMRAATRARGQEGLRRAESKISKILGQRGLYKGSGTEAALMQRAVADMLGQQMQTEGDIGKSLADQSARLSAAGMGALTGLGSAGMQVLGNQEYPMIDALGFYESENARDIYDQAFQSWNESMTNTGQASNPFYGTDLQALGNYGNWVVNTALPLVFGGTGLFD
jgi:hypothetical protein